MKLAHLIALRAITIHSTHEFFMSDNNNLPQKKDNAGLALQKTDSLLSIIDKILANRTQKTLVVNDDVWLDELIAWADENKIPDYYFDDECECWRGFPRDKQTILALTGLYLWDNKLTKLPESFGKLTNLTYLSLSGNQLTELPESIGKLTNLTWLSLSGNQLTELPEFIGKLTNLTWLNLSGNQLTELPEFIGKLTNLTRLELSNNPIKSLPPELIHLRDITKNN